MGDVGAEVGGPWVAALADSMACTRQQGRDVRPRHSASPEFGTAPAVAGAQ